MAKVNGINALFKSSQIANVLNQFQEKVDKKTLESLQYAGEQFVNDAKDKGNYKDRTGNLRSSIGYIILNDGKIVDEAFELSDKGTDRVSGLKQGKKFAKDVASNYSKGLVLIGVAGMEYAAYVENRHHLDVISGSAPDSEFIKSIFNEIKF